MSTYRVVSCEEQEYLDKVLSQVALYIPVQYHGMAVLFVLEFENFNEKIPTFPFFESVCSKCTGTPLPVQYRQDIPILRY